VPSGHAGIDPIDIGQAELAILAYRGSFFWMRQLGQKSGIADT
jgi:hypothetical protein